MPVDHDESSPKSKMCSACKVVKPYSDFSPDRRKKSGRQSMCRECQKSRYEHLPKNRGRKLGLKPKNLIDMTGWVFTYLTVIERAGKYRGAQIIWRCRCKCGNEHLATGNLLRIGRVKSCGCWNVERSTVHGLANNPLYHTWVGMKERCFNPKSTAYKHYGARGITVCERWLDVKNFIEDMLPTHKEGLSIDRINNDGSYTPENCRWATPKQQINNRRNTIYAVVQGEKKSLTEWCELYGAPKQKVLSKIRSGWDAEKALVTLGGING